MATRAAELRDAFQVAAGLPGWADGICAAVERELAPGQPGDAAREWITSAFAPVSRLLMAMALRDPGAGPASTAVTAVGLILVRNMIRAVRQLVPAGSFDVMSNPLAAPFLTDFLGR